MVRILVIICFGILFCTSLSSQNRKFEYTGILRPTATVSPGILLYNGATSISLHGFLEYFPEETISLRGEGYWYINDQKEPPTFLQNSYILFGILKHWHKGRLDSYIGFQPGVSITQPWYNSDSAKIQTGGRNTRIKTCPAITLMSGTTFYLNRWADFFLELRYLNGQYLGNGKQSRLPLDEIKLSAGMSFHFNVLRKWKDFTREDWNRFN